jgi:hypothetical protein
MTVMKSRRAGNAAQTTVPYCGDQPRRTVSRGAVGPERDQQLVRTPASIYTHTCFSKQSGF